MDCYTRDIDTSSCVHVNLHEIKSTLSYGVHGGPQHAELTILLLTTILGQENT